MGIKYRAKPVTIEAIKFTWDNIDEIKSFCGEEWGVAVYYDGESYEDIIYIETLEGEMITKVGDYIIKGTKGEFYPCKSDIFEMKYEKVEE